MNLQGGGGVDGLVHTKAGYAQLKNETKNKMSQLGLWTAAQTNGRKPSFSIATRSLGIEKVGDPGYEKMLGATRLIHTIGPVGSDHKREELLRATYQHVLSLADQISNGVVAIDEAGKTHILNKNLEKEDFFEPITQVSFTSISTGIYGYHLDLATPVAINAVIDYLTNNNGKTGIKEVRFLTYGVEQGSAGDNKSYYDIYDDELEKFCTGANSKLEKLTPKLVKKADPVRNTAKEEEDVPNIVTQFLRDSQGKDKKLVRIYKLKNVKRKTI